jgi:hypothetical protein
LWRWEVFPAWFPEFDYHRRVAQALEHICRMRGGAQSHMLRCVYRHPQSGQDGEGFFITKFQNNPQHVRVLANELLCYKLASHLKLPVPLVEQVQVTPDLIEKTPELRLETPQGSIACAPGLHCGSLFPGDPRLRTAFDYVPDKTLDELRNLRDFWGALLFDQWTCNADARQAVFYRDEAEGGYRAMIIDQGFCFNDGQWNFPDSPLRGLYHRRRVYAGITGWESFEPCLTQILELPEPLLDRVYRETPREWYGGDDEALEQLLMRLNERRKKLPEMITAVRKCSANPFPGWVVQ